MEGVLARSLRHYSRYREDGELELQYGCLAAVSGLASQRTKRARNDIDLREYMSWSSFWRAKFKKMFFLLDLQYLKELIMQPEDAVVEIDDDSDAGEADRISKCRIRELESRVQHLENEKEPFCGKLKDCKSPLVKRLPN